MCVLLVILVLVISLHSITSTSYGIKIDNNTPDDQRLLFHGTQQHTKTTAHDDTARNHVRRRRRRYLTPEDNDVLRLSTDEVDSTTEQGHDQEPFSVTDGSISLQRQQLEQQQQQLQHVGATGTPSTRTTEHVNILAIGGSITWGATLKRRELAYPWIVANLLAWSDDSDMVSRTARVDNLSIRATGADFFSICIETLIEEAGLNDITYDLILFDFSQNGTNGFPFLLRRLHERYPSAVLVYVKLFSVIANAIEIDTSKNISMLGGIEEVKHNTSIQLRWNVERGSVFDHDWDGGDAGNYCGGCQEGYIENLVRETGGYVYDMIRPANPRKVIEDGWFYDDWHHLSAVGHSMLANELIKYLRQTNDALRNIRSLGGHKPLGPSWKKEDGSIGGDQCYFWFMSGQYDSSIIHMSGVQKVDILTHNKYQQKWVMELLSSSSIDGTATIEFESIYKQDVPLGLGYMSRSIPLYPTVVINLNHGTTMTTIDPTPKGLLLPNVHITAFQHIGHAKPGRNIIKIHTLPSSSSSSAMNQQESNGATTINNDFVVPLIDPFRIVGLYLCEACVEMGNLGKFGRW